MPGVRGGRWLSVIDRGRLGAVTRTDHGAKIRAVDRFHDDHPSVEVETNYSIGNQTGESTARFYVTLCMDGRADRPIAAIEVAPDGRVSVTYPELPQPVKGDTPNG